MNQPKTPAVSNDTRALKTATEAYTGEGGHVASDELLLEDAGVSFDGRQYRYETYRYDRREDALAYAELDRARRAASPRDGARGAGPTRPSGR
jgi:hypothetical protein